jgi:hypothetical protein
MWLKSPERNALKPFIFINNDNLGPNSHIKVLRGINEKETEKTQ